jgi:hypothetical protein
MTLTNELKTKYSKRLDDLIQEGEYLLSHISEKREPTGGTTFTGDKLYRKVIIFDENQRKHKLTRNCVSLLENIITPSSRHNKFIDEMNQGISSEPSVFKWVIGNLQAIKDDFDNGFLEDVAKQIEAEVVSDLMSQAEGLLNEGQPGKYDHVPAAVLVGAILEKSMRILCIRQTPPIPTLDQDGKHKKLNVIIDDLKKSGLYLETKAKQLRAWAGIRNDAAHGEFDNFNKADVENMIKGINNFLAEM